MRLLPASLAIAACAATGVVLVRQTPAQSRAPLFSPEERAAIVAYWGQPGRYERGLPAEAKARGPWVVRQSAEGSEWLLRYQRKLTAGRKVPPSQSVQAPESGETAGWESWLKARLAADRAAAQRIVDEANAAFKSGSASPVPSATPSPQAAAVGPAPDSLIAAVGNPPTFAHAVVPLRYVVRFEPNGEEYDYTDHVKLGERFAYYRFPLGVVRYGAQLKDIPEATRAALFSQAGFSASERRIFEAVSGLEGGFETVQTYDTGFVSVGFIQFVTLADGKHDLSKVLQSLKKSDAKAFHNDFRRFGIDVQPDDAITVIDPSTGAELVGGEAVRKIIDDKRLLAIFQRAGRHSEPYRVAQIRVARSFYWPTDDRISIPQPDGAAPVVGTIGEIVKSEAGLATLLDRKINTGNTRPLEDVVARVMAAHGLKSLAEVAPYEQEVIAQMTYRTNFLARPELAQPPAPPRPEKPEKTAEKSGKRRRNVFEQLWARLFGG